MEKACTGLLCFLYLPHFSSGNTFFGDDGNKKVEKNQ